MLNEQATVWSEIEPPTGREEIAHLIAALQSSQDAEGFNRHFAADIVWGNPRGGVISGFETLHRIHKGFFDGPMKHNRSRFTLVNLVFHGDALAVAHVRREALDEQGHVIDIGAESSRLILHEMAMYVFIRREAGWWLAAGQNTPVRPNPIRLD